MSDPLRETVDAAEKVRGVPQVAREVGVAHQTLRKYLNGGRVRADVLGKLEAWASPPTIGLARGARAVPRKRRLAAWHVLGSVR